MREPTLRKDFKTKITIVSPLIKKVIKLPETEAKYWSYKNWGKNLRLIKVISLPLILVESRESELLILQFENFLEKFYLLNTMVEPWRFEL